MSYDFSSLNDKDLEELTLDILSKKLKIDFQSFKTGSDQGIDLRYATSNNENDIVVQVKHYLNSGVSKLKSDLKKNEISKVKLLNPKRYILVTSLALTPLIKEQIKTILSPFILTTNDILGRNEINYYLRKFPDIEDSHFKLWLSSTNVLRRILKNGVKGRSEFLYSKIKDKVKIFVPNKTHQDSIKILNKYNFILITGAPGIGKSTLANMLTYQLLAQEFELIYVREIIEAEDSYIPGKKQVFYFDDFLGSITLDLKSSKNLDAGIVNFIDRIKSDKQKRLIITCRTTLLNQAKEQSEKLSNAKIEISNYEVKIEDYRDIEKAKILYNHVYFSNLEEELKSVFFIDHFYWKVIRHPHYNPRIIEFFTDTERLQPNVEYSKEVIEFLDNPSKIWEKSFTIQISQNARLFLSSLYSFGGIYAVNEKKIADVFEARLIYEMENNNYSKGPNTFNSVIKELTGAMINRIHETNKNHISIEYAFFNPSIEDFLFYYFTNNIGEYFEILKSAVYFDQFKSRITTKLEKESKKIYFGERQSDKLFEIFEERVSKLKTNNNRNIETILILITLFKWEKISQWVIDLMDQLTIIYLTWDDRTNLIKILNYIADNNLIDSFSFSIRDILLALSANMTYYFQIEEFSTLISRNELYREIIEESMYNDLEYYQELQININNSWSNSINYYIDQTFNLNSILDKNELINAIAERKKTAKKINEALLLDSSPVVEDYTFDYDLRLKKNLLRNAEKESTIKSFDSDVSGINETLEVNRWFNSDDNFEPSEVPF